jgi:hypothetical protein
MRTLTLMLLLVSALSAQGCYSYVKTYDGNGRQTAECRSGGMMFGDIQVWGRGGCRGFANNPDKVIPGVPLPGEK